jgi:OmpA-OmpF porin, OOP family
MSSSLVTGLTDVFRSQALGPFAVRSGETESSVLRAFEASVGTMIAGLAAKLKQAGFARQAMDLINDPANDADVLEDAQSLVNGRNQQSDSLGSRFTAMLFGSNLSAIEESIGSVAGLHGGSAASLMEKISAPLLLSSLTQRVRQPGMDISRLASYLSQEAYGVEVSLPAGVRILLGSKPESVPPVATGVVPERSRSWLWPSLVLLAVVAGLIWWFFGRGLETAKNAADATVQLITRALPGNVNLSIPAGRMEDRLLTFIQDPSKPVNDTNWFDFDRLLFDTNSATLQPASQEQLQDIAAILKAYPNVHVKIGGYTDNTGEAAANQELSQQRADWVKQQMINMGIGADRLDAQGYGEQNPVADNTTAQGRQQNRRISLLVTGK